MAKQTFKQFLSETPIGDYQTFGDFSKRQSFHSKRDRMLITNPSTIKRLKKKFENTDIVFNLFFVNSKEAEGHIEVGVVNIEYVKNNLGDEVANAVITSMKNDQDAINVIFTNNSAAERAPFTAWIAAHRLGHAFARKDRMRATYSQYKEASDHLIRNLASIMQDYGVNEFPDSDNKMLSGKGRTYEQSDVRPNQLAMIHFFQKACTFKSAREGNLRDWFEVLNELVAQYLTTGKIKFNKAPKSFGGKARTYFIKDQESADDQLDTLSRDMEYMIDGILGSMHGSILVM